jgi:intracellular sulfur oxidation DsrE/DsrF family protein
MKTIISLCLGVLFFTQISVAQNSSAHKIIFQLQTGDTTSHKVLMRQCTNILNVAPGTQIEVVCHGPGLEMMMIEKSIVASKLKVLKEQGVVFNVCEFSMKERKIERNKFMEQATYVPAGIIEIVTKQEQGWSYIKAGL